MTWTYFAVLPACLIAVVLSKNCIAEGLWSDLESGFTASVPVYLWIREQDVYHDSVLNPDNNIATIPETVRLLEVRPNIFQSYRSVSLNIKPRFQATELSYNMPGLETESKSEAFINEAGIQFAARDTLFLAYAREVLLWGPSMFISVSNPFFKNNGRSDPYTEIGGRDFAKLTHVMNSSWTMTYMQNNGLGRDVEPVNGFESITALKLDYLGDAFYSSLVVSKEQGQNHRLGGYFGMTANSALLLYAEASLIEGTNAFYPVRTTNPDGWEMNQMPDSDKLNEIALAGFSYTFMNGLTLNLEYVYNSIGYNDSEARDYYALVQDASQQFLTGGSAELLGAANVSNLQLLRRNYLFTQLNYPDPKGELDWTLRYSMNLDDSSASMTASMTWYVSENTNIFFLGLLNEGGRTTEYGSYLESLVQLGITYYLW